MSSGIPIQSLKPKIIKLQSKPTLHLNGSEPVQHQIPMTMKHSTLSLKDNGTKNQPQKVPMSAYLTQQSKGSSSSLSVSQINEEPRPSIAR